MGNPHDISSPSCFGWMGKPTSPRSSTSGKDAPQSEHGLAKPGTAADSTNDDRLDLKSYDQVECEFHLRSEKSCWIFWIIFLTLKLLGFSHGVILRTKVWARSHGLWIPAKIQRLFSRSENLCFKLGQCWHISTQFDGFFHWVPDSLEIIIGFIQIPQGTCHNKSQTGNLQVAGLAGAPAQSNHQ